MKDTHTTAREYAEGKICEAFGIEAEHITMQLGKIPKFSGKDLLDAHEAGAIEALAGQWRSVKDELPDDHTMVLCRMASNGAIVSGYITKLYGDYPMVATDPSFHFEDWGNNEYECTHWMPIPELPEDK